MLPRGSIETLNLNPLKTKYREANNEMNLEGQWTVKVEYGNTEN